MNLLTVKETTELLAQQAKKDGIEIEILVNETSNLSIKYQDKKLDEFGLSTDRALGLRIIEKGREGSSYTESFLRDDVLSTYNEARELSKIVEKNYHPEFVAPKPVKNLADIYNAQLEQTPIAAKKEQAALIEEAALKVDKRVAAVPYNGYAESTTTFKIYNSKGVDLEYKRNSAAVYAYCLAKSGENASMYLDFNASRKFSEIHADEVGRKAAEGAIARVDAVQPTSHSGPVVLSATAVNSLFAYVEDYFSAKAVDEKLSLFKDLKGKKIASEHLSIVDDPFHTISLGSRPFDAEGSASQKTVLVEDGILQNFLTNSVYAKKMHLPHTASGERSANSELGIGSTNLIIQPGKSSFEDLLNSYPEIVLIDNFKGMHAGYNSISGNFSLEADGVLYRNGKWVHALKNFVVSGNFLELLQNIEGVGNDPQLRMSSVYAPSMLIRNLSMAGKS